MDVDIEIGATEVVSTLTDLSSGVGSTSGSQLGKMKFGAIVICTIAHSIALHIAREAKINRFLASEI